MYCPVAHAVWHAEGFLYKAGVLDYAGGNAIEIASGISGLVSAVVLGRRAGYGKVHFKPYNQVLVAVGAGMLWFGFNAGSALKADARAGMAMLVTQIAGGMGSLSWMVTERYLSMTKKPSLIGLLSGSVAGMVAITPAAG